MPSPGVSGPAAEIERLERLPESEIALLAAHRSEIAKYFEILGAVRVVIATESIQIESPTQQYADAIRVVLPGDPAKRLQLFDILNREAEHEGYDLEADAGQPVFCMWWG